MTDRYEYHIIQDDNAMNTTTVTELFDRMGEAGWRYVGTVGFNANHIIFEKLVVPYEEEPDTELRLDAQVLQKLDETNLLLEEIRDRNNLTQKTAREMAEDVMADAKKDGLKVGPANAKRIPKKAS